MDEWMFVRATARQMPINYTKQVFQIEVMFRKWLEGDPLRFKAPPFYSTSNPAWVESGKQLNELNQLFNH